MGAGAFEELTVTGPLRIAGGDGCPETLRTIDAMPSKGTTNPNFRIPRKCWN